MLLLTGSAQAAVPTWEELERPFSARLNEIASHPEPDRSRLELTDPRCRNGIACNGDLRLAGEAGTGGDRLVFGTMTGLSLSGRYDLFQVGLDYHHAAGSGDITNAYTAHAGLAWQSPYGLRLEGGVLGGYALSDIEVEEARINVGRGIVGLRGAISYEFASTSTNHLLVGLVLNGGTSLSDSHQKGRGAWGGATLSLGYALDI